MSKQRSGTYEWAQTTVNCVSGCEHDCRYCYARHNAVDRFHQIPEGEWTDMKVRWPDVAKGRGKKKGVIMFPSTHDITPKVLAPAMLVLEKLLTAGNTVLLVSKPHLECIDAITLYFSKYTDSLKFRFTIGAMTSDVLQYWEPGAPTFNERRKCLQLAFERGFQTSISAEPLLEPWHAVELFNALKPHVNWEFWIGMLNRIETRVRIDKNDADGQRYLKRIRQFQTDEGVLQIVDKLKDEPLIRWKDSYKQVIQRYADTLPENDDMGEPWVEEDDD